MSEVNIWDAIIDATVKTLLKQKQELISEFLKDLGDKRIEYYEGRQELIKKWEAKLK